MDSLMIAPDWKVRRALYMRHEADSRTVQRLDSVLLYFRQFRRFNAIKESMGGPLLRLINAARLFPQEPRRELPRHRAAAYVTVQYIAYVYASEFTRQTVSCYRYTVVVCH